MYYLVAKSCPTICDFMDRGLPDSSVQGIFQTRILEQVAIPFPRVSFQSMDQNHTPASPALARGLFTKDHLGSPKASVEKIKLCGNTNSMNLNSFVLLKNNFKYLKLFIIKY